MRLIYLGDKVRIHGWVPMSLLHLNQRKAVISSKEESFWDSFGCFGVAIYGISASTSTLRILHSLGLMMKIQCLT